MVHAKAPLSKLAGVMQVMPQSLYAAHVDEINKHSLRRQPARAGDDPGNRSQVSRITGRLLVRASGTEPLIRVMIEGPDQREIDADVYRLSKLIEKELA